MLEQFQKLSEVFQTIIMYVEQSITSSYTLTNLINDLLDLAKLEQATFQLNEEYFNLFEVVNELF